MRMIIDKEKNFKKEEVFFVYLIIVVDGYVSKFR